MLQVRHSIRSASKKIGSRIRNEPEATSRSRAEAFGRCELSVAGERFVPHSWEIAKRLADISLALVLFIVVLPLLLIALVAIVIRSPGCPFFLQNRVGRFGKPFRVYKLRTMRTDAHVRHHEILHLADVAVTGPVIKLKEDPRVFPIGRFLRRTSIDELPNLVNVLMGEMSLVGPRPMQQNEIDHCTELFGEAITRLRLSARPGITCSWQISGRSNMSFAKRIQLDLDYASTWTPFSDLRILLATIPAVLTSKGAY